MSNSGKCPVNRTENTLKCGAENTTKSSVENTKLGEREIGGSTVGSGRAAALSSGLSPHHSGGESAVHKSGEEKRVSESDATDLKPVLYTWQQQSCVCDNPDEDLTMNWLPMAATKRSPTGPLPLAN